MYQEVHTYTWGMRVKMGIDIRLVMTPGANPFSGSFDPQKNKFKLTAAQITALNNRQLTPMSIPRDTLLVKLGDSC